MSYPVCCPQSWPFHCLGWYVDDLPDRACARQGHDLITLFRRRQGLYSSVCYSLAPLVSCFNCVPPTLGGPSIVDANGRLVLLLRRSDSVAPAWKDVDAPCLLHTPPKPCRMPQDASPTGQQSLPAARQTPARPMHGLLPPSAGGQGTEWCTKSLSSTETSTDWAILLHWPSGSWFMPACQPPPGTSLLLGNSHAGTPVVRGSKEASALGCTEPDYRCNMCVGPNGGDTGARPHICSKGDEGERGKASEGKEGRAPCPSRDLVPYQ